MRVPDSPRSRRRQQTPVWLAGETASAFAEHASDQSGEAWLDGFGEADGLDSRTRMPKLPPPVIPPLPRTRGGSQLGGETVRHRTLLAGATARQAALTPPAQGWQRPTRKGPAVPAYSPTDPNRGTRQADHEYDDGHSEWNDCADRDADDERDILRDLNAAENETRRRGGTAARPLARERISDPAMRAIARIDVSGEPLPELAAYRAGSAKLPATRRRLDTRALARTARNPWARGRFVLAILAICLGIWTAISAAGEPSQPLMATWQSTSGTHDARAITSLVQPETQGTRPDLYDSNTQFNDWWDAACSAAVSSEVLTAWGVPHATIGKLIDVMQPDISLNGGLLTMHGFVRAAGAFGYRADISSHLTYKQMLYLTNTLGLPVIVNVRISYGYYHFFSGGHFLVMTGGDSQGLRIVDSSEYYIKYLPLATFNSMFTGITAVIVPNGYSYTLPQG